MVSIPSICSDPTLPTTAALRGVVPLIDPAVGGEATENANSATSIVTPFAADGMSVAQVMIAQGFSNFTQVAAAGGAAAASGSAVVASSAAPVASVDSSAASVSPAAVSISSAASVVCGSAPSTMVTVTRAVSVLYFWYFQTFVLIKIRLPHPYLLQLLSPQT